ncbi:Uu.00g094720.m01.CDS01 [Anthostomella pinea]|uniref:Uu.00g094720.m01.CDS01 n=1 Tax=Anthostomella pinea TaxID=933095 RepID=A0AAI8VNP2_9PEZI|nr:Uu.00g094720.m01.CDS01 [Anthostomella pinea]
MSSLARQLLILTSGIALLAIGLPHLLPFSLLRLAPLISSTVNLMWAADEYMFLSAWLPAAYRTDADALLPRWFRVWGPMGSLVLFSSFPFSLGAAIANLLTSRDTSAAVGAAKWYWAGLVFTTAHFGYAPRALRLLKAIRKGKEEGGDPTGSMRRWIGMHLLRVVTADLPAFLCFATAVLSAMRVVA